ncbi:MAG: AAA family ATPase [Fibrobacteraceae bacterium]|nr:AAA family ATPase [Fibrobacteraceae bacterium]
MKIEFRFNLESTKKHLKSLFPNENVRNNYLKAIAEYVKFAAKENNANWNVNLDNDFIRVNCGARYILEMKAENIRVMCWRETFLKLDKDFIDEFLKEVFFHKKDTKELMASDFNPQTYEELEKVPANILWHNSLQFNINPKLWAEKYAEKLMPSVLDFCKDCIKHSSIMPQMRKAHSASLIELINKEMNENLIQPEYIKEQLNYENDDLERFKSLLEYFVTHMEYVVNENKDFVGYSKYIFPIQDSFKKTGIGYKGQKIQTQIANWSKYKEKEICINVHASHGSFQKRNCYLNWKGSWNNVHVEWKENNITSLYLSKEPKVDAKKELEKTIEQLGLFSENITDDLKAFFDEYMKWGIGDSQMTDYEKKLDEIKNNLLANKNVILTGAPGTGKTFMAKTVAERMGCTLNEIRFVQFHPSYDYTDFVEGLRPIKNDNSDQIGFERKDGVFKKFCEKALKNLVDSRKNAEEITKENDVKNLVNSFLNEIYENETKFKTSSTENEFQIKSIDENFIIISIPSNEKTSELKLSISDIHQILLSDVKLEKVKDLISIFNRKNHRQEDSYLFVLCKEIRQKQKIKSEITEKIPLKNFVFIIDEINRGEVAKIFGELFYSVDPGYRVTSDDLDAIKNGNKTVTTIKTQYANLETDGNIFDRVLQKKEKDFGHFFIPENVYIIGTMNDIDRSVESMDFAFRRRFSWIEVKASDTVDMLDSELSAALADEAKRRMENLNNAISEIGGLNEAYHIGASYFLKLKNYAGDFESLWEYHIKGILQEYLRGNPNAKEELDKLKVAYDKKEE